MNETEQIPSNALPLAAAAARLGIRPDALRMRINRGKIKGFKRGGRLFTVLDSVPGQAQRTANTRAEQPMSGEPEQRPDARSRGPAPEPDEPSMPLVIEFQKVELSRLLRDNSRLNHRLDQMMEELRHLREMQQREQVLRQQDQALRQRAQALIERLTATPIGGPATSAGQAADPPTVAPPPTAPGSAPTGAAASAPQPAPASSEPMPSILARQPVGAAPRDAREDAATEAGSRDELPDSLRQATPYAYESDTLSPEPPPGPPSGSGEAQAGEPWDGARGDSAELADMLKEIGDSLRGADTAAMDARTEPPPAPGTRREPGVVARPPEDDEAGLLEILGRMGPSSEDRRTAARLMKRLLKGRAARRRDELGNDED